MAKRILGPIAAGMLLVALSIQSVAAAPGGGGASFTLSPNPLGITTPTSVPSTGYVTVTTRTKAIALVHPATSSDPRFVDTTTGTCWTSYGAFGLKVPANTSCTIGVSFLSNIAGTFTGTLSVAECTKWHLSPSGGIACDRSAAPQMIGLTGTAIVGLPDLFVLGVVFGNIGGGGPAEYRVDVGNDGLAIAQPGVYLEGWWSRDEVIDSLDQPACWGMTSNPIAPPAGAAPVFVTCFNQPSLAHDYLIVDLDHGNAIEELDESNNIFVAPLPPH